jgi:hypothetical protein
LQLLVDSSLELQLSLLPIITAAAYRCCCLSLLLLSLLMSLLLSLLLSLLPRDIGFEDS